jgi:multimeric flavodoxin WrbA
VHWADVILLATPIRWGAPAALYTKLIERLNCIQNQITTHGRVLIRNKVAAFVITGGQDNVQAVAGQLLMFWAELGFVFPPFPFIAHSRGWDAEDMARNVRVVKGSEKLRTAAAELAARALEFWRVIDPHREALAAPMERGGRKAQRLLPPEPEVP